MSAKKRKNRDEIDNEILPPSKVLRFHPPSLSRQTIIPKSSAPPKKKRKAKRDPDFEPDASISRKSATKEEAKSRVKQEPMSPEIESQSSARENDEVDLDDDRPEEERLFPLLANLDDD